LADGLFQDPLGELIALPQTPYSCSKGYGPGKGRRGEEERSRVGKDGEGKWDKG